MYIDLNGDRQNSFTILDMDPESGEFQVSVQICYTVNNLRAVQNGRRYANDIFKCTSFSENLCILYEKKDCYTPDFLSVCTRWMLYQCNGLSFPFPLNTYCNTNIDITSKMTSFRRNHEAIIALSFCWVGMD